MYPENMFSNQQEPLLINNGKYGLRLCLEPGEKQIKGFGFVCFLKHTNGIKTLVSFIKNVNQCLVSAVISSLFVFTNFIPLTDTFGQSNWLDDSTI